MIPRSDASLCLSVFPDETDDPPKPNNVKSPVAGATVVAEQPLKTRHKHHISGFSKSVSIAPGLPSHLSPEKKMGHLRGQSASIHALPVATATTPNSDVVAAFPANTTTSTKASMAATQSSFVSSCSTGAKTWAEKLAQS